MTSREAPHPTSLQRDLLERLRPLARQRRAERPGGMHSFAPDLFSYSALERERIKRARLPHPTIGIVLSGAKEVWLGGAAQLLKAGDVFVFPGIIDLHVVNIPDERSGLYESLLLEVPRLPASLPLLQAPASNHQPPGRAGLDIRVPLSAELVDALAHAALTLARSAHAAALAEHRMAEVLLLLRDVPAARPLFASSLADQVAWVVLGDPAGDWTAASIADRLGMGASTLRRRLGRHGASLREVVRDARMGVALRLLAGGEASVTEAAQAAGYASRSHFARGFRAVHGVAPSRSRLRSA